MRSFCSLWLLPPEPVMGQLQQQVNEISQQSKGKYPTFMPHITIVGGFPCGESDKEAELLLKKLEINFKGFGPIPCTFTSSLQGSCDSIATNAEEEGSVVGNGPMFTSYTTEGDVLWNQACVAVMRRSTEYIRAIIKSREILFPDLEEEKEDGEEAYKNIKFPPPIKEPHLSYAYGNDADLCVGLSLPPDFLATEIALFKTYPVTLEGVSKWNEVGRFDLL